MNKGFDINNIPKSSEWLPIGEFDNKKFELLSPEQWLEFYQDEAKQRIKIGARALFKNEQDIYLWKEVQVDRYDSRLQKWVIIDDGREQEIERINLVFNTENKQTFALRFINAYLDRIYKNSELKLFFFVKSMPTEDIRRMKLSSKQYIMKSSLDVKRIAGTEPLSLNEIEGIIDEFYNRNCNRILFEEHMRRNPNNFIEKNDLFFPEEKYSAKKVAEKGLIKLPRNTFEVKSKDGRFVFPASFKFEECFKLFCLNSIFTKDNSLQILKEVGKINQKIEQIPLFQLNYEESLTLTTFKKQQENQATQFMSISRTLWGKNLVDIIRNTLSKEKSGWFDLNNINLENYDIGKLKGLLQRIDLSICDQIKYLVEINHKKYVQYFMQ